jgi:hypothetical protein
MTVVKALDVLEQLVLNVVNVNRHVIKKLGFYAAERRFSHRVIPAVASPAHALDHSEFAQPRPIRGRGVRRASIGVVQQPGAWSMPRNRPVQAT